MKNFDWDAFGENQIAVWCKTEEEAIDFCSQSYEHGYDWCGGGKRNKDTFWEDEKEETCYTYDSYDEKKWLEEEEGYIILSWSDFMNTVKPTFTKSDLKDGDMILRRNGVVEIAIPSVGVFVDRNRGWNNIDGLAEDLTDKDPFFNCDGWDIIEIRRPVRKSDCQFSAFEESFGEVVYNRERDTEVIEEMTLEEVCEALGKKIKIVEE